MVVGVELEGKGKFFAEQLKVSLFLHAAISRLKLVERRNVLQCSGAGCVYASTPTE